MLSNKGLLILHDQNKNKINEDKLQIDANRQQIDANQTKIDANKEQSQNVIGHLLSYTNQKIEALENKIEKIESLENKILSQSYHANHVEASNVGRFDGIQNNVNLVLGRLKLLEKKKIGSFDAANESDWERFEKSYDHPTPTHIEQQNTNKKKHINPNDPFPSREEKIPVHQNNLLRF